MMQTNPKTSARTHDMFRGLIHGFEGFNQVRIARIIEVSRGDPSILSMCRRGLIQSYLGDEVRTTKETNETYYNLEQTWVTTFSFCF